jgi:diguanylate cyclase (GGDEF)-like protein
MKESEARKGEKERLAALKCFDVLDTPAEEAFDRIARLAHTVLRMPIVTIAFVDAHRQWFKSRRGVKASEAPRDTPFCREAMKAEGVLIVEDALADPRFAKDPWVTGETQIRFYGSFTLRTRDGHAIGALCVFDDKPRSLTRAETVVLGDLGKIAIDELELRRIARSDSLTGSLSRQAFREEAMRDFALAKRHKHELSCMVLDVDHFRRLNDTFGRDAGDAVLAGVVDLCNRTLRASDYVGRVGGEEFAIMLPQTSGKAALEAADRLRRNVEKHIFDTPAGPIKTTISIGIAPYEKTVADIDALLRRCDVALYGAKSGGRNRVVNFATQHLSPVPRVA